MAINTDTPDVRPPTAEDMANNGFAPPPSDDFASAPKPEYETAEDAYKAEPAGDEMADFASKAMATPSRYDSDLIKDITGQIDAELEQKKLYAGTELDEFMSQRGMVGSSVEGELRKSMLGDMERQRQERLNELNVRAADSWAADRAGVADIGFKSAEFQRSLGGDKENAARYEAEFGQSQYEFDKTYGQGAWSNRIEEKRLELTEKGMDQDDAYRKAMSDVQEEQFAETLGEERAARVQRYGLDIGALENETRRIENEETGLSMQQVRDQAEINLRLEQLQAQKEESGEAFEVDRERIRIQNDQFRDRLGLEQLQYEEQRAARIATIGLSQEGLDQSAERLQLDALVQGRTMDLQEARNLAEIEHRTLELSNTMGLEQARLKAQDNQFQAQHNQSRQQWADSLGLERGQYEERVNARNAEYDDRRMARLDQMNLQDGTLEHEAMQNSLSRTLEREALELQKMGMDEESSWRNADRIQQEKLESAALAIQQDGLTRDSAWRQALNDSNERMQEVQLTSEKTLMGLGISSDAARDITRELHESTMNAANITSTEKIEGLARALQQAGLDAETAWRAATDASNEARANADKNGQAQLQKDLMDKGITADKAAATAAEGYQKSIDAANNSSREAIQDKINTAIGSQLTAEAAWRNSQQHWERHQQTLNLVLAREENENKRWATDEDRNQREWEFSNANNTQRLGLVLGALADEKIDNTEVKKWMGKYPSTDTTDEESAALATLRRAIAEGLERERLLKEELTAIKEGTPVGTTGGTTGGTPG